MSKVKLLPHNQETFEKIIELYKFNSRVCAIQATGTGKSYLICRLLEEYEDLHAIIFSPNDDIIEQTEGLLKECDLHNAECVTYQKLLYMSDEEISNIKADLIIIDEFHRVGAYKWGRKIQHLLDSHESSKLFGVTATPIRPSDGKDMSEEIFYGNKACDISLAEAIVREIVKMPIYVSGLFSFEEEFVNMKNKIEGSKNSESEKNDLMKELSAAKKQLEKSCGVPEIIRKHITDYNGKYIVFCQNTIHLKEMIDVVKGWFIDAGYSGIIFDYSVGSKIQKSKKSLNEFKENNKHGLKLLFCIDKLNEGLHMPKVSGVILLRPTKSNIIYYQQIGRTIDAKRIESGIILDLVANFNSLDKKASLKDNLKDKIEKRKSGKYRGCSIEFDIEKFHVYDEIQNCVEVFNSIDSRIIGDNWTQQEDQIIIEEYPERGCQIVDKINRTKGAIRRRAEKLGVYYRDDFWTTEEDNIIIEKYPEIGNKVLNFLPGRDLNGLLARRKKLGIKTLSTWVKDEDDVLIKYFPEIGYKVCEKLPNRTKTQIRGRVERLGLKKNPKPPKWKEQELERLPELYKQYGTKCNVYFEGKSKNDIKHKAIELGLSYSGTWTKEEKDRLKNNFETKTEEELKNMFPEKSWKQIVECYKRLKYKKAS